MHTSPSCPIIVSNEMTSMNESGPCDDGSSDGIASAELAQAAALKDIGRFEAVEKFSIQVTLTFKTGPETFTFLCACNIIRLTFDLSAGGLALKNMSLLVADAGLSCKHPLVGFPVLRHFGIDSCTLSERNRATLGGPDCSDIQHFTITMPSRSLERLLVARLQRVTGHEPVDERDRNVRSDPLRPRGSYCINRFDEDPFPDPNLVGTNDDTRFQEKRADIEDMLQRACNNGLLAFDWRPLHDLVLECADL